MGATQNQDTTQNPFGLLILDIDHFKQVNDLHGHDAGDTILKGKRQRKHMVDRLNPQPV
jgi:diguanylate cyclase (GGDEF)-like protein